jgi:hypothetical protein
VTALARSLLTIGAVLAVPALKLAAADRVAISAESGVFSQYVWRGLLPTNGPVLQNSATALWRGTHVNIWTNQDLNSANGVRGKFNEVDFDAGYDHGLKKAGLSAGVIRYTVPNTPAAATTELYAGATLAAPLRPAVKAFFDVDGIRGAYYLTFDVSDAVPMPKPAPSGDWSVELAVGAGWGSSGSSLANFGVREPGRGGLPSQPGCAGQVRRALERHAAPQLRGAGPERSAAVRSSGPSRLRRGPRSGLDLLKTPARCGGHPAQPPASPAGLARVERTGQRLQQPQPQERTRPALQRTEEECDTSRSFYNFDDCGKPVENRCSLWKTASRQSPKKRMPIRCRMGILFPFPGLPGRC